MVNLSVSIWSDEELKEKFKNLSKKGDWDKECKTCKYPEFLHKAQCLRSSTMEKGKEGWFAELWKAWSEFKERVDPIRSDYEDEIEKNKEKLEEDLERYRKDNEEMAKRQETSEFFIEIKAMSDA